MTEPSQLNLILGWISMIGGAIAGAVIGLYFHDDTWMGGYASLRRRMLRLGHIAFFGLGMINVLFALTVASASLGGTPIRAASIGFAVAVVAMPACCLLTAWRPGF
ncbi:MAG TPA: hypothetical protein VLV48_10645, partial [Thermoanaerobaculia bacterium]|nr:hypothetical protein [Thermoanaerobaculia bacterium]